jgi:hypothetical protein
MRGCHLQLFLEVGDEVTFGGQLANQVVGQHELIVSPLLPWILDGVHLLLVLVGWFHTNLDYWRLYVYCFSGRFASVKVRLLVRLLVD